MAIESIYSPGTFSLKAKLYVVYFMRYKFAASLKFGTFICPYMGIFQTVTLMVIKCIVDVNKVRYLSIFH